MKKVWALVQWRILILCLALIAALKEIHSTRTNDVFITGLSLSVNDQYLAVEECFPGAYKQCRSPIIETATGKAIITAEGQMVRWPTIGSL